MYEIRIGKCKFVEQLNHLYNLEDTNIVQVKNKLSYNQEGRCETVHKSLQSNL